MPFGTVKMYDEDRGFGFIKPDDGGGASMLQPRQAVEFESVFDRDRGKYRAADVRII